MTARHFAALVLLPLLAIGGDAAPRSELSDPVTTATQTMRFTLDDPDDFIRAVAFSPDGRTLATGTSKAVILWDRTSGNRVGEVPSNPEEELGLCRSLVFSPGGKRLATVHDTRVRGSRVGIRLWDVTAERQLQYVWTLEASGSSVSIWRVAFSPDGAKLVTGQPHGMIAVWDIETGQKERPFHGGVAADFSPDGETLISVTGTGAVHRWAVGTNRLLTPDRETTRTDFIHTNHVAFAPNGRCVSVGDGYSVLVKDTQKGRTVHRLGGPDMTRPLAFSPNGRILAVVGGDGLSFFDTITWKELSYLPTGFGTFSPDGHSFAWLTEQGVQVEETATVLARGGKAPAPLATNPPNFPLEAELVVKQDTYLLDLGGLTSPAFAEMAPFNQFPTPQVDLVFRLKNTGDKPIKVRRQRKDLDWPDLHLEGQGAINIPLGDFSTGVGGGEEPPEPLTLAPGATASVRLTDLEGGFLSSGDKTAYWVLPGDYRLQGELAAWVSPAPKGAETDGIGFGLVWVRCPPAKLTVRSACLPPLDPIELDEKPLKLGALIPPSEDYDTLKLRGRLLEPVNFPAGVKEEPLDDILAFFADKYHLTFYIDEAAFARAGKKGIRQTKTGFPPRIGVALAATLYLLLDPLDADFDVRGNIIWIVPRKKPQGLADRLSSAPFYYRAKFRGRITFKDAIAADTPLAEALETLHEGLRLKFLIDEPAFERAGIKGIAKKQVQLAAQKDVRPDQLLYELLHPIGARIVIRNDVVVIEPAR